MPAINVLELISWPHTKDGANGKIGVNDAAAVQRVKGHAIALSTNINWLWYLL